MSHEVRAVLTQFEIDAGWAEVDRLVDGGVMTMGDARATVFSDGEPQLMTPHDKAMRLVADITERAIEHTIADPMLAAALMRLHHERHPEVYSSAA